MAEVLLANHALQILSAVLIPVAKTVYDEVCRRRDRRQESAKISNSLGDLIDQMKKYAQQMEVWKTELNLTRITIFDDLVRVLKGAEVELKLKQSRWLDHDIFAADSIAKEIEEFKAKLDRQWNMRTTAALQEATFAVAGLVQSVSATAQSALTEQRAARYEAATATSETHGRVDALGLLQLEQTAHLRRLQQTVDSIAKGVQMLQSPSVKAVVEAGMKRRQTERKTRPVPKSRRSQPSTEVSPVSSAAHADTSDWDAASDTAVDHTDVEKDAQDEALQEKDAKEYTTFCRLLEEADSLFRFQHFEDAIHFYQTCQDRLKSLTLPMEMEQEFQGRITYASAICLFRKGLYEEALALFNQQLPIQDIATDALPTPCPADVSFAEIHRYIALCHFFSFDYLAAANAIKHVFFHRHEEKEGAVYRPPLSSSTLSERLPGPRHTASVQSFSSMESSRSLPTRPTGPRHSPSVQSFAGLQSSSSSRSDLSRMSSGASSQYSGRYGHSNPADLSRSTFTHYEGLTVLAGSNAVTTQLCRCASDFDILLRRCLGGQDRQDEEERVECSSGLEDMTSLLKAIVAFKLRGNYSSAADRATEAFHMHHDYTILSFATFFRTLDSASSGILRYSFEIDCETACNRLGHNMLSAFMKARTLRAAGKKSEALVILKRLYDHWPRNTLRPLEFLDELASAFRANQYEEEARQIDSLARLYRMSTAGGQTPSDVWQSLRASATSVAVMSSSRPRLSPFDSQGVVHRQSELAESTGSSSSFYFDSVSALESRQRSSPRPPTPLQPSNSALLSHPISSSLSTMQSGRYGETQAPINPPGSSPIPLTPSASSSTVPHMAYNRQEAPLQPHSAGNFHTESFSSSVAYPGFHQRTESVLYPPSHVAYSRTDSASSSARQPDINRGISRHSPYSVTLSDSQYSHAPQSVQQNRRVVLEYPLYSAAVAVTDITSPSVSQAVPYRTTETSSYPQVPAADSTIRSTDFSILPPDNRDRTGGPVYGNSTERSSQDFSASSFLQQGPSSRGKPQVIRYPNSGTRTDPPSRQTQQQSTREAREGSPNLLYSANVATSRSSVPHVSSKISLAVTPNPKESPRRIEAESIESSYTMDASARAPTEFPRPMSVMSELFDTPAEFDSSVWGMEGCSSGPNSGTPPSAETSAPNQLSNTSTRRHEQQTTLPQTPIDEYDSVSVSSHEVPEGGDNIQR